MGYVGNMSWFIQESYSIYSTIAVGVLEGNLPILGSKLTPDFSWMLLGGFKRRF